MSRKEYIKSATMFNELLHRDVQAYSKYAGGFMAKELFDTTVQLTADIFQGDNNRFDRQRFLNAVYKEN